MRANSSLAPTRYGRRRLAALGQGGHRPSAASRRLPPRAAQLERKVRWSRSGMWKRGGARVIYFLATDGTVWLLIVYSKAEFENLPASFLAKLRQEIEDAISGSEVPG